MKIPEKGVVYKASPRAYIGNYLIAVGVIILAFLVANKFGLDFNIAPSGFMDTLDTLIYVAFGLLAAYLFAEPLLEGTVRHYIVSNSEIVKVEGILWKRRQAIPYQSIAEVNVVKGIFGRIFNYGTVEIAGLKEIGVVMRHVSNPEEIQRLVEHKVNSMRSALTRRAKSREKEDKDEGPLE